MAVNGYFVDAGLLVLLVVGRVGRDLIRKHRRLREFNAEDFEWLTELLNRTIAIFVTPNTLSEASNLLRLHGDPERKWFMQELHHLIDENREIVVASVDASNAPEFDALGLTDAALLLASSNGRPILTVDFHLYQRALMRGQHEAINFHNLRWP